MKKSHLIIILVVVLLAAYLLVSKDKSTETQEATVNDNQSAEMMEQEEVSNEEITNESEVEEESVQEDAPADSAQEAKGAEHVFTLDSFNFGYSETELKVKVGDTVTINLTNSDGFHDWVVDEFSAATEKIRAGGETSVTFVADQAGTFEYYCSVGSHRANGMVGTLIVE